MRRSEFRVAFCYNMRPDDNDADSDEGFIEYDPKETIEAVSKSLKDLGFNVFLVEYNEDFVENLKKIKPNLVFDIVEGCQWEDRESQAPAIYEFLGLRYTGSTPLGHILGLNKTMAKYVMAYYGIKTPGFQVFSAPIDGSSSPPIKLRYPLIVKPEHEGSSIGIHNDAIVRDESSLIERVNYIIEKYKQSALVEEFIEGREFNQAIIGNKDPVQFPIVEIGYSYLPEGIAHFSSFEVKTTLDIPESTICPARLTKEEEAKVNEVTMAVYRACRVRDYCRIDMRMDANGDIYILEINTIPGIAPSIKENNSMVKAIRAFGWTYKEMIGAIVNAALERYNITFDEED